MAEETVLGAQSQSDEGAAGEGGEHAATGEGTTTADPQGTQDPEAGTPEETGTGKGDGEQQAAPGEGGEDAGEAGAEGAPESYAEFQVPDGVTLDAKALEQFVPLAQELDLSQASAQKLVDLQVGLLQADAAARDTAFTETLESWRAANQTDAEFGGEKWAATQEQVGRLVERFGTPGLKELFNETGVGDHTEVLRFAYRLAQVIAEDTPAPNEHPAGQGKTRAQRMYPDAE